MALSHGITCANYDQAPEGLNDLPKAMLNLLRPAGAVCLIAIGYPRLARGLQILCRSAAIRASRFQYS